MSVEVFQGLGKVYNKAMEFLNKFSEKISLVEFFVREKFSELNVSLRVSIDEVSKVFDINSRTVNVQVCGYGGCRIEKWNIKKLEYRLTNKEFRIFIHCEINGKEGNYEIVRITKKGIFEADIYVIEKGKLIDDILKTIDKIEI